MIGYFELFWKAITIPLSWLPPLCLQVLETLGIAVVVTLVASIIVKLIKAFK